jgi:hypothetical protein
MAKKRPSLADIMQEDAAPVAEAASPRGPGVVVPLVQPELQVSERRADERPAPPREAGRGVRRDKPHTTIYLDPRVRLAIKRIALDYDRKPHDLMMEGIDMMLTKYAGKTSKDIT